MIVAPEVPARRRGRPLVWTGAVLLALGIVAGAVFVGLFVQRVSGPVGEVLSAPVRSTPFTTTVTLRAGTYGVYERTETRSSSRPITTWQDNSTTITGADVVVTAPTGSQVQVHSPTVGTSDTITRQRAVFTAAVVVDIASAGLYTVSVTGNQPGTEVIVAPTIAGAFTGAAPLALGVVGAAPPAVLGLVLLGVGLLRRRPAPVASGWAPGPAAAVAPAGPPPGWYPDPDPSRPGGRRWWDGRSWTPHTA